MRIISIALAFVFLITPALADTPPPDAAALVDADVGSAAPAGSGSAVAIVCPAGQHAVIAADGSTSCSELAPKATDVPNPVTSPVMAWDDVKVAKRTTWALLVWLALVMLGKALAYGRDKLGGVPVLGKLAAWLAKGKGAMVVAAVGAVGTAGYDALMQGGTWVSAIVVSGAALGGVLHSTTKPKPAT
jgi:hypothetical protein